MKSSLPNILAIFKPNFIPSSRPTSYHVLHMIFPQFMILRLTSPQPDSLAFAKLSSLTNYKAFALTFSKVMTFSMTFALTMTSPCQQQQRLGTDFWVEICTFGSASRSTGSAILAGSANSCAKRTLFLVPGSVPRLPDYPMGSGPCRNCVESVLCEQRMLHVERYH